MTDRERWIVYPLIFLTLGIALRDKITRTLSDVELIDGKTVAIDLRQGAAGGEHSQLQLDFAHGQIEANTIHCQQLVVEHIILEAQLPGGQRVPLLTLPAALISKLSTHPASPVLPAMPVEPNSPKQPASIDPEPQQTE